MEKNDLIFDITNIDIDLSLGKKDRLVNILDSIKHCTYNGKIKVNDTVIEMNFLGMEKLSSKAILKVLR